MWQTGNALAEEVQSALPDTSCSPDREMGLELGLAADSERGPASTDAGSSSASGGGLPASAVIRDGGQPRRRPRPAYVPTRRGAEDTGLAKDL